MVNRYQPTGEVMNPILDSPVGVLDLPDVGMAPKLARSPRDGYLD